VWFVGGVLGALAAALLFANVVATRQVLASDLFETSQKVAQTILLWLVPGFVFVVWGILREGRRGQQGDRAIGGSTLVVDWIVRSAGGLADHGDGGGHHHDRHHDGGHQGGHDFGHHGDFGGGGQDGGGFGGQGGNGN